MLKQVFEDDLLLVIDKPAGLVVDRSETQVTLTLEDLLASKYSNLPIRSGIVHRLDKDTSGLLLVAKTAEVLENLQRQFQARQVKKEYLALAHGVVEQAGVVAGNIGRNPGDREKFTVLDSGKEAVTEYEPVSNFEFSTSNFETIFEDFNKIQIRKLQKMNYGKFTLVRCFPQTGRTHQIRVHLKYIGHPLVADEKYAGRKVYRLDHRWCPRQFLHAAKIGFYHPSKGEWVEFESPLPPDLHRALEQLDHG